MAVSQAVPATRKRRFTRQYFLRLLAFGIVAFVVVALGVMLFLAVVQVNEFVRPTPSDVTIPGDLPFTPEAITFSSKPDARTGQTLTLAGWFVPSRNGATIVLLHGYDNNRLAMRWHAEHLYKAGYGLLMYDERASGESEGTLRSYGWQDVDDVDGALRFLSSRLEVDMERVGLVGCSMGAIIGVRAAAQYPEIRAVIADGLGIVASGDMPSPATWFDWLSIIPNWMVDRLLEARVGMAAPPLVSDVIDKIEPRPLLLIAGGSTPRDFIGSEARRIGHYLQFAGDHTELWVIPEATHCDGPGVRPDEYHQRMLDFFEAGLHPDEMDT